MAVDLKSGLSKSIPIQCTAGAIPYLNEKGEVSMKKVKVQRYVSGKRPEFAKSSDESSEGDAQENIRRSHYEQHQHLSHYDQRSKSYDESSDDDNLPNISKGREGTKKAQIMERLARHKQLHKENETQTENHSQQRRKENVIKSRKSKELAEDISESSESGNEDSDENEEVIEKRRLALRQRMLEKIRKAKEKEKEKQKQKAQPPIKTPSAAQNKGRPARGESEPQSDEGEGESLEEEESEEDESDDDMFNKHQRLKPVFVPKKDRITIKERENDEEKQKQAELKAKKQAEERRRETLKIVEEEMRREHHAISANAIKFPTNPTATSLTIPGGKVDNHATVSAQLEDIDTGDEYEFEDEKLYEDWKARESSRLKRDREERERLVKERAEFERWHNMTEEERNEFFRQNPKVITNKALKGKYRFLQKYYHRGAFFLDEEADVLKRDVTAPTLEDHFDKTIMPKIMQVKNFGKAGRTKYTHLVDQDTTAFDSPWSSHNPQSLKFVNNQAGGMKQVFSKPSKKK